MTEQTPIPVIPAASDAMADETALAELAAELGLPFLDLDGRRIDPDLFRILSAEAATRLGAAPVAMEGDALKIAIADPLDLEGEKRLRRAARAPVLLAVAPRRQIDAALKRAESSGRMLDSVSTGFAPQIVREDKTGQEQVIDLDTIQGQSGVVLLTNSILMAALQRQGQSDIHIEALSDRAHVKYLHRRVDGVLNPAMEPIDVRNSTPN